MTPYRLCALSPCARQYCASVSWRACAPRRCPRYCCSRPVSSLCVFIVLSVHGHLPQHTASPAQINLGRMWMLEPLPQSYSFRHRSMTEESRLTNLFLKRNFLRLPPSTVSCPWQRCHISKNSSRHTP